MKRILVLTFVAFLAINAVFAAVAVGGSVNGSVLAVFNDEEAEGSKSDFYYTANDDGDDKNLASVTIEDEDGLWGTELTVEGCKFSTVSYFDVTKALNVEDVAAKVIAGTNSDMQIPSVYSNNSDEKYDQLIDGDYRREKTLDATFIGTEVSYGDYVTVTAGYAPVTGEITKDNNSNNFVVGAASSPIEGVAVAGGVIINKSGEKFTTYQASADIDVAALADLEDYDFGVSGVYSYYKPEDADAKQAYAVTAYGAYDKISCFVEYASSSKEWDELKNKLNFAVGYDFDTFAVDGYVKFGDCTDIKMNENVVYGADIEYPVNDTLTVACNVEYEAKKVTVNPTIAIEF